MPKGQLRGNREVEKSKAEKPSAPTVTAPIKGMVADPAKKKF